MPTFARRDGVLAERLLDETIVLDPASDRYTRLNGTGRWVWEQLSTPRSLPQLADGLATAFDVDREAALSDLTAFLEQLEQRGLVERSD